MLAATEARVLRLAAQSEGATWLRDHDGLPVGPLLFRDDGVLVTLSERRTLLAFDELTGRELWRIAPPRIREASFTAQGGWGFLGTDAGDVFAVDLRDGQVQFRLRAGLPVRAPPLVLGRKLVVTLGGGARASLVVADSRTGKLLSTTPLELQDVSPPIPLDGGFLLAGEREGRARVVSISPDGKPRWQRSLHLGPGPYVAAVVEGTPLVVAKDGSAARLTSEGRIHWRIGSAGEPLLRALPPQQCRGVLVVAGEHVRAVDPVGGRILAEVDAGAGLRQFALDSKLGLFLADEEGHLFAYRLASHFSVVTEADKKKA